MGDKRLLHPALERVIRAEENRRAEQFREVVTQSGEKAPAGLGFLTVIATDASTGEIRQIEHGDNMVVKLGRSALAHLLAGDNTSQHVCTAMTFGDGAVAPAVTDTGLSGSVILVNGLPNVPVTIDFPDSAGDDMKVRFTAVVPSGTGNGGGTQVYREACMVKGNGAIFSRKVTGAITKDNTVVLTAAWSYLFTILLCILVNSVA